MMRWFLAPSRLHLGIGFAAVLAAVAFVLNYAVEVPFWDDWEFVRLLDEADRGALTWEHIFGLHNEHRIVVPRLCVLGLAAVFGYSTRVQCLFTVAHLTVMLLYVHAALRRPGGLGFWVAPPVFPLVAWLLLSWRQVENLVWGFQIGLSLPLTLTVISLFHLQTALSADRRRAPAMVLAILAAVGASFSSTMGLLAWPAGLLMVILHWWRTGTRSLLLGWSLATVVVWVAYFADYAAPRHHAPVTAALLDPLRLLTYFARLCGSWSADKSPAAGVATIALVAFAGFRLARRRQLAQHGFWLGLITFCALTLTMIAAGRSTDPATALSSRYTTYCMPILAASLVLVVADAATAPNWLRGTVTIAVLFGGLSGYRTGNKHAYNDFPSRSNLGVMLIDYRNRADSELGVLYPKPTLVRQCADFLARRRWSVFAAHTANERRLDPAHYFWGDALRLGVAGNARPFLGEGWSIDEVGFVWSGKTALVLMQVAEARTPARLELEAAMVNVIPGRIEAQRVLVCSAGRQIGEAVIARAGQFAIELASSPVAAGRFELELRFPDAFAGADLGVNGERRVLGVAVSGLRIVGAP